MAKKKETETSKAEPLSAKGNPLSTSKSMILSAKDKSLSIPDQALSQDKCGSCNTSIVNDIGAVKFPCPKCGKYTVIRCLKCRKIVSKYKCPNCGFEGPN